MIQVSTIHQEFGTYLFNFIKSKVSSAEDARDIYQEVILKILNKPDQLAQTTSLKSWLFTIAKNQIIDHYRSRRFSQGIDAIQSKLPAIDDDPGKYRELEKCLYAFINSLPADYKDIVIQSEMYGKSQKELAESLGINYVTVRSKIQRGREKIKKMIHNACSIEKDTAGRFVECSPKTNATGCGIEGKCGSED